MKSNISQGDKLIRISLGIALGLVAAFTKIVWLAIIGAILLGTALINFCPIYRIFNFSTRKFHESPFHAKAKKKHHR